MQIGTTSLFVFFSHCSNFLYATNYLHPNAGLNSKQMIQKYGYPLEVHKIETEDGYILETYRIPHGKSNVSSKTRYPVLLVPGMFCTSLIYLNLGPGLSLGFMLADEGYDVWLANVRGTKWSKMHKTLDPVRNGKEFFDYSFHEIGMYDLPANIDYILKRTNFKKLFCVGHSQGTTSFFVMAAVKPQYNKKVILMTALSPVVYVHNVQHVLVSFAKHNLKHIQKLAVRNNVYELLPHSDLFKSFGEIFCNDYAKTQVICAVVLYIFGGYSSNLNKSALPAILSEYPSGTSTKTLFHYTQLATTEQFQMYDYRKVENMKRYGMITPPKYNISEITAPVALYYGGSDSLSTRPDVEVLVPKLPNIVKNQFIKDYNHMDFIWSKSIVPVLHSDVIQTIKEYSKQQVST